MDENRVASVEPQRYVLSGSGVGTRFATGEMSVRGGDATRQR